MAYLAAERILHVPAGPAEWQPVLARELPPRRRARPSARSSARAREHGLQPLRWPEPFPFDSALAMRVATYAKSIGRVVPFAQAAFRQAFAGGRPRGARLRADRRRRLRDAPARGAARGTARSVAAQLAATTHWRRRPG